MAERENAVIPILLQKNKVDFLTPVRVEGFIIVDIEAIF